MKQPLKSAMAKLMTALLALGISLSLIQLATPILASGGSGSGGGSTSSVDTIKVSKCYYFDTGSSIELLINASSSNSSALLNAYLPDGTYLGQVQNGGGGRYGG